MKRLTQLMTVVGLLALLTGCASPQWRGTPFYGGAERQGMADLSEERINMWPLLQYEKDNVTHVLWPLVTKTDDMLAVRPLYSITGLDEDQAVHDVLWPLARFDPGHSRYHIFPAFWGKDYFNLFPLYWHSGDPFGAEGGRSTFLLLWSVKRDPQGYDVSALASIINFRKSKHGKGWRVWPLIGNNTYRQNSYGYYIWPLGWTWSNATSQKDGSLFFPLYYHNRTPFNSEFYSLLFSRSAEKDGARGWHAVTPLYYTSKDKDKRTIATLLGGYSRKKDGMSWMAVPLLSGGKSDKDGSMLVSPLYWKGDNKKDNSSWNVVVPLYYWRKADNEKALVTLLGGYKREGNECTWMALPLLGGGKTTSDGHDTWIGGPLAHFGRHGDASSSHVFPFYYRDENAEGSKLLSPLWSGSKSTDGSSWQFVPLLYCGIKNEKGDKLNMTPLYASGKSGDEKSRWHSVIPLYYKSRSEEGSTFATMLGGVRNDEKGKNWLIYPLLSGGRRGNGEGNIWVVAPLFHAKWDKDSSSHHLLPFYYWNGESKILISPFISKWRSGDKKTTLVPHALSWTTESEKRKDIWGLGGVFHTSWGEEAGSEHLLPLYYRDKKTGTFVTPVAAKWKGKKSTTYVAPPLVSWLTSGEEKKDLWLAGPLMHFSWGKKKGPWHILPLLYSNPGSGNMMSPLAARWKSGDTTRYIVPPMFSWLTCSDERRDLWIAGPLMHFSSGKKKGASHVFPAYYSNPRTKTFMSLPYAAWNEGKTRHHAVPPLLSWYSKTGQKKEVNALLGLVNEEWGVGGRKGHFIPFYLYDGGKEVYTPIVGWNNKRDSKYFYPLTPLVGIRRGTHSGGWLFPLGSYDKTKKTGDYRGNFLLWGNYWKRGDRGGSGLFPVYGYRSRGSIDNIPEDARDYATYGKRFWCLPICWYRNQVKIRPDYSAALKQSTKQNKKQPVRQHIKKHGVFPLYSSSKDTVPAKTLSEDNKSLLMFLYTYNREIGPVKEGSTELTDESHSRVLWQLYHKHRENDNVSVDIFPAITYDRREDGSKKVSFLWRFFRYERTQKSKKLDLLFIPIIRKNLEKR